MILGNRARYSSRFEHLGLKNLFHILTVYILKERSPRHSNVINTALIRLHYFLENSFLFLFVPIKTKQTGQFTTTK